MKTAILFVIANLTFTTATYTEAQTIYEPYVFTTIAGKAGSSGKTDGPGGQARFGSPSSLAFDQAGNLYVAEASNNKVRMLAPTPTNWMVSTVVDLPFDNPQGIIVDQAGNIFLADFSHYTVREVIRSSAKLSVRMVAGSSDHPGSTDGPGSVARFNSPSGLAVDTSGNIYVSDYNNNTIREITAEGTNWMVTTIAGHAGSAGKTDGLGADARFSGPTGVAADNQGNLYVTDRNSRTVRKISKQGTDWIVSTMAGQPSSSGSSDGFGLNARFSDMQGVAVDRGGNVFIADVATYTVRKITPLSIGTYVTTPGGRSGTSGSADGTAGQARFNAPAGVCADAQGNIYVADIINSTIRMGTPALAIASFRPTFGIFDGNLAFELAGSTGEAVSIENSTDFVNWHAVSTKQLPDPSQPPITFQYPATNKFLFYRVRTP
jgi:sugar lactone lactonase YvrE